MSERVYTVSEISALRRACENIYLFGDARPTMAVGCSRSFKEADKVVAVEAMIRTYMQAGLTAQDLYESHSPKVTP